VTVAIAATGIFKSYGLIPVLRDVSLSVRAGETLAIIGPNGAGKTTLFKTLTGEVLPEKGRIEAYGEDVTRMAASDRVARGFARTFQVARIYPETTLIGNVILAVEARRRLKGESLGGIFKIRPSSETQDEARQWLEAVGLSGRETLEARFLSHGDKKGLEMALALALRPKVLMMDEPTAGMSPSDRIETVALVKRIRTTYGVTVMLTEHDMDVVFGLSDRIMVLNYGQVIAVGSGEEIRANPAVRDVYLGHEAHHA
jgi:branched-chain amino acid transport system ATP-binding protein